MAIETQECAIKDVAAGGMTEIPVPFPVNRAADLIVTGVAADGTETAFVLNIDYTVSLSKDASGFPSSAAVHFPKALPAGTMLTILRQVPVTQGRHFTTGQGYFPEEMERALDLLTMMVQQLGHPIEMAVAGVKEIRAALEAAIRESRAALEAEAGAREDGDDALDKRIAAGDSALGQQIDAGDAALVKRIDAGDAALAQRFNMFGDPQRIIDAAEVILGVSADTLSGAVKTIHFTSDGVTTAYSIPGPEQLGRDIPLMAFDAATRRRVYFSEKTEMDGSITLELAEPLPEGARFGVVYLRALDSEAVPIQKILNAADAILDMSAGKLAGAVKTIYFTSDGAATTYPIPRPTVGRDIPLMAFDTVTRRRIWFAEKAETDGSATLEVAEALPAGTRFGVVYLRAVDDASTIVRHVHTEATPAATWSITHDLVKGYPRLFLTNSAGQPIVAGEDWSQASAGILTLTFCEPVAGVAMLTGYPADSEEAAAGRYPHNQPVPAAEWVIAHDIVKEYPRVFVLDAAGGRVFGGEDWSQAGAGVLTLTFSEAVAGVAILTLF